MEEYTDFGGVRVAMRVQRKVNKYKTKYRKSFDLLTIVDMIKEQNPSKNIKFISRVSAEIVGGGRGLSPIIRSYNFTCSFLENMAIHEDILISVLTNSHKETKEN